MPPPQLAIPFYVFAPGQTPTPSIPAGTTPSSSYSYFVLNMPSDPNFVGYTTSATGQDSPEVRENAQNQAAKSGGLHGLFYAGRRPFTFSGPLMPQHPSTLRNDSVSLMEKILLKGGLADCVLTYTPDGDAQVMIPFRVQQPLRVDPGIPKTFQFGGVCADYRALSVAYTDINAVGATLPLHLSCVNAGTAPADFVATITGPITAPWHIYNATSGFSLEFNTSLTTGQTLQINTYTNPYPVVTDLGSGLIKDSWVNATSSYWDQMFVESGTNDFQLLGSGAASGTTLRMIWHDAYA